MIMQILINDKAKNKNKKLANNGYKQKFYNIKK